MTEPQVWTFIGVFAAALFGMLTLMATVFVRLLNAKFDVVNAKLEHLDRDVKAIARRVFPERE